MKNLQTIIIIVLLILIGFGINYHFNVRGKDKDKYEAEVKLREALTDSIRTYKAKNGDLMYEKRSLQGDIDDLLGDKVVLSAAQKELLNTVDRINKERKKDTEVFAAAQIKYKKLIDSLNFVIGKASSIDTVNNKISFYETDTAAHFIYDIDVLGVRPYPLSTHPEIVFNSVDFPNTQIITLNFDKNKRKDYPVSFSVMNTNKYFEPLNIESYVIEGVNKENINPTGWKKIFNWIKINGKYILVGAAGFGVGSVISSN